MKIFSTVFFLATIAVIAVLVHAAGDKSAAAVERAVLERFDRMAGAAEALNVDELFRDVAENDKGAVVLNGRLLLTRNDALQTVRENFRGLTAVKYQFKDRLVTVLSPTSALLVATGTTNITTQDGRDFSRPFTHSIVFALQDGKWRVVHSHQSNPPPP